MNKSVQDSVSEDLTRFGDKVLSPQVMSWILDAERNNPYVKSFDSWGRRRDELITTQGWQKLQELGIVEGMAAIPYENRYAEYSRVYHCAKYVLWCGSAAWVNCPTLMVDGVASLLRKHLSDPNLPQDQRPVLKNAYERLVSRDPAFAWTTGQWMTERPGGSDVSRTETLATYDPDNKPAVKASDGSGLGLWSIDGFKWFSSATDANMMMLLARTPKGISTFLAPMRRFLLQRDVLGNDTELNGVHIQRLKNKLGTRALPTAELELNGVRGWLVGEDGRGTKEIATVLNIARIHNGLTAIGLWGRALGIVRAFTRVRMIGQRPLWERTAFMRSLARMHVEYRGNVLFNFFVCSLLGVSEQPLIASYTGTSRVGTDCLGKVPGLRDTDMAHHLLRVLTPALKWHCSKTSISGLQECMECLGGVGYLENEDMQYNLARLYRDANVMPIWEGTTDMMADDAVLRVLHGKSRQQVMAALEAWVTTILERVVRAGGFEGQSDAVAGWWADLKASVKEATREEAEMKSRAAMDCLVDIVQGLLLLADAISDQDEVARLVAESWFSNKTSGGYLKQKDWMDQVKAGLKMVLGVESVENRSAKL